MYPATKTLLFRLDPETAHEGVMSGLAWTSRHPRALRLVSSAFEVRDPRLEVRLFGLTFPNPIGLAAGFDKNARAVPALAALGFGSIEVGSVTALAQEGNPRPRLFRLPEDRALINRLGFNNEGANRVAARLEALRQRDLVRVPIGVNIGKSKVTPLEEAAEDYRHSLTLLWPYADYLVINVSSPNTPGLRQLQERDELARLLEMVMNFARAQRGTRPVLLKIAPDLDSPGLDNIVKTALEFGVAGIVATNTTIARKGLCSRVDEAGGLSGEPLRERSLEFLHALRTRLEGRLPIISVGGIATADDVFERFRAGAKLVQLYTGFVYEGPTLVKRLNRGLLKRLERENLSLQTLLGARDS